MAAIQNTIVNAALRGCDPAQIRAEVEDVAKNNFIDSRESAKLVVDGWRKALDEALADHMLSLEEEHNLLAFAAEFPPCHELKNTGELQTIERCSLLRRILTGEPLNIAFPPLPFNFQKSEQLVYAFPDTAYHEFKTRTQYVGGSQGVSVRVARGLYFRTGSFRGERIQTMESVHADTGVLGLTTKHVYFSGATKRFRVPYSKIVAFEPYSDGIGIQRDAVSARPQTFVTNDGWFTYNLAVNLAQMSA